MQPETKRPQDIDFEALVSVLEDTALDNAQELCGFMGESQQSQAAAEFVAHLGQAGMSVLPTAYVLNLEAAALATPAAPATVEAGQRTEWVLTNNRLPSDERSYEVCCFDTYAYQNERRYTPVEEAFYSERRGGWLSSSNHEPLPYAVACWLDKPRRPSPPAAPAQ